MTLVELFKNGGVGKYPTDKGSSHSYLEYYDQLFLPYRDVNINILEVGFLDGGSCKLWEDYFTQAKILGLDITDQYYRKNGVKFDTQRVGFRLDVDINNVNGQYFNDFIPNIAIDDASHLIEDQCRFVKIMYPLVKDILIIEDIAAIDEHRQLFENIGYPFEVVDFRGKSGRWDDVLIIYKK
jgi:hypothetical protein